MPYHSLNMRKAMAADASGEVAVGLFTITHEDLDAPIRLSTDPTVRLTTDPLVYGTRHQGEEYLFLPMGLQTPDQVENAPMQGALLLENIDASMIPALRKVSGRARIDIAIVLASSPDLVEESYGDFCMVDASGDVDQIEIRLGRTTAAEEPYSAYRMTSNYCPGLRR